MTAIAKTVRDIVDQRAEGFCEFCCRYIGDQWFSRQHRIPRGAGGSKDPKINAASNLILLCGSATSPNMCHQRAESQRHWAKQVGLLVDRIQNPADVPVLYRLGWARLDNDGGVHELPADEADDYGQRMNLAAAIVKNYGITTQSMAMMTRALDGQPVEAVLNGGLL